MYEEIKNGLLAKINKVDSQWIAAELGIVKCLSMLKDSDERFTILKQLEGKIIDVEGKQSESYAKVKLELGNAYLESGEYAPALNELQQGMKLLEKKINEDYINCRASTGFLYSRQGKYREALSYLIETERIAK